MLNVVHSLMVFSNNPHSRTAGHHYFLVHERSEISTDRVAISTQADARKLRLRQTFILPPQPEIKSSRELIRHR